LKSVLLQSSNLALFLMQKILAFRRCKAAVNPPRVCKKYQSLVDSLFFNMLFLKG